MVPVVVQIQFGLGTLSEPTYIAGFLVPVQIFTGETRETGSRQDAGRA